MTGKASIVKLLWESPLTLTLASILVTSPTCTSSNSDVGSGAESPKVPGLGILNEPAVPLRQVSSTY